MTTERDHHNVGIVCPEHAPKPNAKYADLEPEDLLGYFAKLGFKGKDPAGRERIEHMWVLVTEVRGRELVGELDNVPILEMEYECGDIVGFEIGEIEDVHGKGKGDG